MQLFDSVVKINRKTSIPQEACSVEAFCEIVAKIICNGLWLFLLLLWVLFLVCLLLFFLFFFGGGLFEILTTAVCEE